MEYKIARVSVRKLAHVMFWVPVFVSLVLGLLYFPVWVGLASLISKNFVGGTAILDAALVGGIRLLLGSIIAGISGLILGVLVGLVYNYVVVRIAGPLVFTMERTGEVAETCPVSSECVVE